MPTAQDVILNKGNQVHSIDPSATVLEAVQAMNQHQIGALLVMDHGRVAGIFTERDVLRRVLAEERSVRAVRVGEVMTRDVICVPPETDLDDLSAIMQTRRVRHIPICDEDGQLRGMVSIGDINAHHANHQEAQIHFLSEYIYGRA
jgi:CBS domain-containing protein